MDHAVDWKTAKANFKIITSRGPSGDGEAPKMWMWGQRQVLLLNGFNGTVPDRYIDEKCKHPLYKERVARVARIKQGVVKEPLPQVKKACKHSSFELGLSYHARGSGSESWLVPGR